MIDVFNIPSSTQSTFTFYATGNWETWTKPRGAKMIQIFCLGAGGGGSRPTVAPGIATGGAGGASGGIVKGLIPAFLLPDTLYILVGKGGVGPSTSNTAGGSGGISYISTQPSIIDKTLVCKSSSTVAGGGGNSGSAGGTAPTIAGLTTFPFANLGLFSAIAGVAGVAGGANTGAAGNSQNALGNNLVTGGAGGGGKTTSVFGIGGRINEASVVLTSTVLGGITTGQNGDSGYGTLQPFCGTGGAGGAGIITGQGGEGGNGYYGCGGGGAGAGSVVSKAGNGGDGLVIITVIS